MFATRIAAVLLHPTSQTNICKYHKRCNEVTLKLPFGVPGGWHWPEYDGMHLCESHEFEEPPLVIVDLARELQVLAKQLLSGVSSSVHPKLG